MRARDLALLPGSLRRVARAEILERALVPIQLGDQRAEAFPGEFRGAVAEHQLRGGVDRLDQAAVGVQGDDAVRDGIEYRLDQRGIVAQALLHRIFFRNWLILQHFI